MHNITLWIIFASEESKTQREEAIEKYKQRKKKSFAPQNVRIESHRGEKSSCRNEPQGHRINLVARLGELVVSLLNVQRSVENGNGVRIFYLNSTGDARREEQKNQRMKWIKRESEKERKKGHWTSSYLLLSYKKMSFLSILIDRRRRRRRHRRCRCFFAAFEEKKEKFNDP